MNDVEEEKAETKHDVGGVCEDKPPGTVERTSECSSEGADLNGGECGVWTEDPTNIETVGLPGADSGDGCSEKGAEVFMEVQDADTQHGDLKMEDTYVETVGLSGADNGDAALELGCGAVADGLEEEKVGAVTSAILGANGQDHTAVVLQEREKSEESFRGDADARKGG